MEDTLKNEIRILQRLDHQNIIKYYGCCFQKEYKFFVMEWAKDGNLSKLLSEENIQWINDGKKIALDVSKGLAYLHEKSILHRDLRPDNILITKENGIRIAKLADMGLSRTIRKSMTGSVSRSGRVSTIPYSAPELFQGTLTPASDIFSFGVILWQLCSKKKPWADEVSEEVIMKKICAKKRESIPEACDERLRNLIKDCWKHDYDQRPTSSQVTCRLQEMR